MKLFRTTSWLTCALLTCVFHSMLFVVCDAVRYKYPFQNPNLPFDKRTDDLVNRLTIDEIILQTIYPSAPTPRVQRLGIEPFVWWTECIRGERTTNATAFPNSIGLAATWNYDLIRNMSEALSLEVRARWNSNRAQSIYQSEQGIACFSPEMNIARHPLWGRIQETYGEDPYLTGRLSQAFVRGLQGSHDHYLRVGAGCKAFDLYGGPENLAGNRFSFNANVSTFDWRMTYLPAFKMCVDVGVQNIMCSYNSVNGIPSCANKKLLTDVLRKEWGFSGYVVSDDGAIMNIKDAHHYTSSSVDTVVTSIRAGTNLELSAGINQSLYQFQKQALDLGKLSHDEIRTNAWPLFYTRLRLGEFDPPDLVPYNKLTMSQVQSATHRQLAITAAQQSFVLLKNNILPLKKKFSQIAVVGPMANNSAQLFGDYSSDEVAAFTTTPLQGFQPLADHVTYGSGCDDTKCQMYNSSVIASVVSKAQLVVVCLGSGQAVESEGMDRSDLQLPGQQLSLLKDVVYYAGGSPVILLLFNAGPLDVTWAQLHPGVSAIMACFYPAQSTGKALYNVLTATGSDGVPAGRLPITWPANLQQVPSITDYSMTGRTYRYLKQGVEPLYPFGYGLSYTSFKYSFLHVMHNVLMQQHKALFITVNVTNTGSYSAQEVVQVYLSWPLKVMGSDLLPRWQLVGFKKVFIEAGRTEQVMLEVQDDQLLVWVEPRGWDRLKGNYTVYVGGQQPNQRIQTSSNILSQTLYID